MSNSIGFVYIWMDVKRSMFYVGSHIGQLNDGYVGSSVRLRRAYKKRPFDFKRRILFTLDKGEESLLRAEEERWLGMIKVEELGTRYYNLKRVAAGGRVMESYTAEQKDAYRAKLRASARKGGESCHARKVVCFGREYSSLVEAKQDIGFNPQRRLNTRRYEGFYFLDQGPITPEEIERERMRKDEVSKRCVEARTRGVKSMSKEKQSEKGLKAARTREKNGLSYFAKVAESLRNRPGREVSINGVIYGKGRIAAEILDVQYGTLKVRLRSKSFPTWFYVDNPTKGRPS